MNESERAAWLDAAFSDSERDAILAPSRLTATGHAECVLRLGRDGAMEWQGTQAALDEWQHAVIDAAAVANPFEAWSIMRTAACFRGMVDQSIAGADSQLPMPRPEQRALRRAAAAGISIELSEALRAGRIDDWLERPVGQLRVASRYLHELWLGRPDLHGLYPRVGDRVDSTINFLAWVAEHGVREIDIPDRFRPTDAMLAWRLPHAPPKRHGVRLVGLVDEVLGIGEAARNVARALRHAGIETDHYLDPASVEHDVNIICLNADELPTFMADVGDGFSADRHTIGVWFWETTAPPRKLAEATALVDEIWVASKFVRDALTPHVDGTPIHVMPLAVAEPRPGTYARSYFGLPDDAFIYGYMFDFNSTLERKNACGLVDAYVRAYPEARTDTALVIKSIQSSRHPHDRDRLMSQARDRPDIVMIDAELSIDERDALLAHFDCYVSLHRSEGFGLTIAESLLAGVPTIATGYSANIEFADADVCYLVDYEMVAVPGGLSPYPTGGLWAEPDLEHAAQLMLHVREHESEARAKGQVGRDRIRARCSLDSAASFMRSRLERLWKDYPLEPRKLELRTARDEHAEIEDPIAAVERYVHHGPSAGWLVGSRGIRRVLRRVSLRVARPYADRQKELEVDIARSLRSLQHQIDDLRRN